MTGARPAQRIEMIPVDRVNVVNPRVRNKKAFRDIVDNIAKIGLKKPITVTRRIEAGGPFYDLVCGQGRLEAFRTLGQAEVPALVVSADPEDCLVASLVENCARRQHRAIDLLQDIRGMQERGYSNPEIARKTGLSLEYVHGVARLIEKGEQRLLRSVESGTIPVSVAVEIAEAPDHDVQAALSKAYENGQLKGRRLLAARKLIEMRRRRGKGLGSSEDRSRERVSADTLVKAYQEETERKRALIARAETTQNRLMLITEAMRRLSGDEGFLALLEDEDLATMPERLAERLNPNTSATT
ncbi:plasmid partitioning protein RepB C-terminal domain-containing protein [Qipengyuania atrilutea]|uniref:ParB N-terminal domain-containing protein n=1 Tax=Qipengyuania atrilutea TaxID=2744473 RepID=A0A850H5E3_9SPHN|nr:plasmid partitioning protein RepB C-terminal domain-containing protein [Actirhodobacter atriluteus]NVD45098.1 ParB N-terminal domain-containing protein [Actirhodobacter atriluteus]